ncbi:glycosyltransferase family 9 protein [Ferruginibacter albus]|uniref:glycosyltransferase family 9 protein n=1 Tax=Ferruginibacter albus TaxID=2875540 RepID=UPI001CC7A290|nr:hypothetical protein [Ferruginibacter albus]UAY53122.1 hypothetical protein K9M53_05460 [Ferruginibacter albus]
MASVKKILLLHLYSNGDCLYATTIAKQIKTDYPGCHLSWAIASFCKNIITNNPYVDEILIVDSVKKNDVTAFRKLKKEFYLQNKYDEIFITQNMEANQAFYDGSTRSNVLRAYPHKITVPVTPVLRLTQAEIATAQQFALQHRLSDYKNVILFEYAPQSGQSKITKEFAVRVAEDLTKNGDVAVVLSSANKINSAHKAIIDGSVLTMRETAALTHYCTFLLGTTSGITWLSTSDAAKQLPMLQLFTPYTRYENPVSRDFKRFNLSADGLIEILQLNEKQIVECVNLALQNFPEAKQKYNQSIPLHFKTTRSIVYNLLCYLQFNAILTHIKVNREVYGNNPLFYKEVFVGFITFPFKLVSNLVTKRFK